MAKDDSQRERVKPSYHLIKRRSDLNLSSKHRRKKGKTWFTETSIRGRPVGHKCEINDIVYIYIIDYGLVARGKVLEKKVTELNNLSEVVTFINHEAKYKEVSYWGDVFFTKLSDLVDSTFSFYVLEVHVDVELLDEVMMLDPKKAKVKEQGAWKYLDEPIEKYTYESNQLSPIIPPQLRQKIQIEFNSVSDHFVYDVDHFVPKNWGGPGNIEENLIPLALSVNRNKSDKIPAGLFFVASKMPHILGGIKSKYFNEKYFSKTNFLKDIEAKEDAKKITNIVSELDINDIKKFYSDVRRFHYGNHFEELS